MWSQGLVVPVVRNVQSLSLADIEKTIAEYGVKVTRSFEFELLNSPIAHNAFRPRRTRSLLRTWTAARSPSATAVCSQRTVMTSSDARQGCSAR